MNIILSISILINITIVLLVTFYVKKHVTPLLIKKRDKNSEYEAIFRSIFECAPYSIVIQRIDNGACVAANNAFLQSMGISKDDLYNFSMDKKLKMTPEEGSNARQYVLKAGGVYGQEAVIQKIPGSYTHVLYSSMPIIFSEIPCLISLTIDITKQKKRPQGTLCE